MSGHNFAGARPLVSLGVPGFVVETGERLRCRDNPDAYFRRGLRPAEARELCTGCGYLAACGAFAVGRPELLGVWGGLTARERQASPGGERGPPRCRGPGQVGRPVSVAGVLVGCRPGRRCAHRVTGRAAEGVTDMAITAEMVAEAEAEVTEAERVRAVAEEALMGAPNSTLRAQELAGALKRVAQSRANARELREAREVQAAAELAAASREELERAAAGDVAAAGRELKAGQREVAAAAVKAQAALLSLVEAAGSYDALVVRHAAVLGGAGLGLDGVPGGGRSMLGVGRVRLAGAEYEQVDPGKLAGWLLHRLAVARLHPGGCLGGLLEWVAREVEQGVPALVAAVPGPDRLEWPAPPRAMNAFQAQLAARK